MLLDPDASAYDPSKWNEVFTTNWTTPDDIEVLYGAADARILRERRHSAFEYGYDSIANLDARDTFAGKDRVTPWPSGDQDTDTHTVRAIRTIDRQYRKLRKVRHFVDHATGDMRRIPDSWDRERVAAVRAAAGLEVIDKLVRAIRWTVTADDVVLKDEWSPYNYLTVVPYFPYFMYGQTAGMVEDLLGPQELLNKATSQELHVINTTANSGWKVRSGALTNMTVEELEQKGAQTGLVLEVNDMDGVDKISPNQVPTGLDRVTFKAEEHIKSVSGVNDSMQGFDREDVAARAIEKKRQAGSTSTLSKPLDNLTRSDFYLARNILDLVQTSATGAVLGSDSSAPVAANDVIRVGPLPAGFRLVDSLVIVSDAAAGLNGKIGFAYQDGKDDAKVPQDDDYFGAAVALSAVARVRNATGNASVTLPKDAYLTVAASAAVAEAATVEVIVFGIAEGVQ